MVRLDKIYLVTDGGCRSNPGPASIGYGIYKSDWEKLKEDGEYIGKATNNEAEYEALILGLDEATEYCRNKVEHFTDSKLVVNQLEGEWAIKASHLKKLINKVNQHKEHFDSCTHKHLPRDNKRIQKIDQIANEILDEGGF